MIEAVEVLNYQGRQTKAEGRRQMGEGAVRLPWGRGIGWGKARIIGGGPCPGGGGARPHRRCPRC